MDVQNIRFLHEKPYRVSWKADGTRLGENNYSVGHVVYCLPRYLMYIRKEGEIYMLDRDNSVFSINLKFLSRKHAGQHIKDSLVDGVGMPY